MGNDTSSEPFVARHGRVGVAVRGPVNAPRSTQEGRFGRIFPRLASFAPDTPKVRKALLDIGAAGGPMDPGDQLNDPIQSILNPDPDNPDNIDNDGTPRIAAGMTFLGQFLDHDMTFDAASSLDRQQDPDMVRNFRSPALELDSLYGNGPGASPHLYDRTIDAGATSFYTEEIPGSQAKAYDGRPRFDVPRNAQLVALVGDPRDDENLIVSQLHLAFLRFHNKVVERVRAAQPGLGPAEVFLEAQRLVRWHYQWIIVRQFLRRLVGTERVRDVLDHGNKFYKPRGMPFMPVEFAVAAYRFGHSQVRPSYRANFGPTGGSTQFFAFVLKDGLPDSADPDDLRGQKRAARRFIDWQTFFDFGDGKVRPSKKIDVKLSTVLFDLVGVPGTEPQSLAQRNLLRNLAFDVPSGQAVAEAMDIQPLAPSDLDELRAFNVQGHKFERATPLWYYVLKEAQVREGGRRLGHLGGRIVAEVMIGFMRGDETSYLFRQPGWDPSRERVLGFDSQFDMRRLLKFAGVVPDETPPS